MECKISDIQQAGRFRLMGTIVAKQAAEGMLRIDDGTGQIDVFFDQLELIEKLGQYKEGDRVIVIGWSMDTGVSGDIIKSARDLDLGLYEQVQLKWSEVAPAEEEPKEAKTNKLAEFEGTEEDDISVRSEDS